MVTSYIFSVGDFFFFDSWRFFEGILPHDGKNIQFKEMGQAIRNTYNFSSTFCYFVPHYTAQMLGKNYNHDTISLSELDIHNGIEHDASLCRKSHPPPPWFDKPILYDTLIKKKKKQVKIPISAQIKAILMWNWSLASYPLHLVKINKQESLSLHPKTSQDSHLIVESKHKLWIQISSLDSSINYSEVPSTLFF